jgi:hypothetical protein
MAHDVFLSYSNKDKAAADAVCHALERNRIRVWMAPRDVMAGVGWAQSIIGAINGARVMVLVFSGNANGSPQIEREVERAVNKGVPVVPIRIENVAPNEALEYFISAQHWLDAFTPPFEQHVDRLADAVKRLLESEFVRGRADEARPAADLSDWKPPELEPPAFAPAKPEPPAMNEPAAKKSNWVFAAAGLALIAVIGGGALFMGSNPAPKPDTLPVAASPTTPTAITPPSLLAASTPTPAAETQQTEFDEAMAAGTVEKLDAFVAKNPKSPLAKTAKRERERLSRREAAATPPVESNPEPASVTDCDRLAASPTDADRIVGVDGVAFEKIDAARAVPACAEAVRSFPGERRLSFQYGLALMAAQQYEEAHKPLRVAAYSGSAAASDALGWMYAEGRGVAKDDAEATRLFRVAAEAGYVHAMAVLAFGYESGRGAAKDEGEALRLYRKAADAGDAEAMFNLGNMYAFGRGVARDDVEAARLYRKAADAGNASAMANLGAMYANGRGVAKNEMEAAGLLRKAADAGDATAMTNLASGANLTLGAHV